MASGQLWVRRLCISVSVARGLRPVLGCWNLYLLFLSGNVHKSFIIYRIGRALVAFAL